MIDLFLLLLCVGGAFGGYSKIDQVYYKYDAMHDGYFPLPKIVSKAKGFQYAASDKGLNVDLYSHRGDPRFFLLADYYGDIVGIRIGYIKEDLPKRAEKNKMEYPYKFENHKMFSTGTFWGKEIYHTDVLMYKPDDLIKGGVKDKKGSCAQNIYLKLYGEWTEISRDQCDAERLGFTEQGCFVGMGKHYFLNMTKDLDCNNFEGVFLLYEYRELVGLGVIPIGTFTPGPYKSWFEDPPASVVKIIVPNRPKCLTEWVSNYGTTSLHVFFKKNPRLIGCGWPFQKPLNCKKDKKRSLF